MKRSAAWALIAALGLGGLYLLAVGLFGIFGTIDCSALSTNECALALELGQTMGHKQAIFGLSLLVFAGAATYLKIGPGSL